MYFVTEDYVENIVFTLLVGAEGGWGSSCEVHQPAMEAETCTQEKETRAASWSQNSNCSDALGFIFLL